MRVGCGVCGGSGVKYGGWCEDCLGAGIVYRADPFVQWIRSTIINDEEIAPLHELEAERDPELSKAERGW